MVDEIKKYETVIIKNVNIVDVILGEIVYDQSVYIKNGRFSKIRPGSSTSHLTEENEKKLYMAMDVICLQVLLTCTHI